MLFSPRSRLAGSLGLSFLLFGFASYPVERGIFSAPAFYQKQAERPFHTHSFRLPVEPTLDRQKPLALTEYGGWIFTHDTWIGAINDQWIGAFSERGFDKALWMIPNAGGLTTEPVGVEKWVFFSFRNGSVAKVNAESGTIAWTTTLDTYVNRPMIQAQNKWIVSTATGNLYALDIQSGKVEWLLNVGSPHDITLRGLAAPICFEDHLYIGSAEGEIVAIRAETGSLLWKKNPFVTPQTGQRQFVDILGEMLLLKGKELLFTRNDGFVGTLHVDTQTVHPWISIEKGVHATTSQFRDNRYYVGSLEGKISAFDVDTQKLVWETELGYVPASLTVGEQYAYVIGTDGKVTSLHLQGGAIHWVENLEGSLAASPIYVPTHHSFYVASPAGYLYGYLIQ